MADICAFIPRFLFSAIDTELAMYALTLVNKCLYALNDQDTFYDQTDYMEELNMTSIIDRWEYLLIFFCKIFLGIFVKGLTLFF